MENYIETSVLLLALTKGQGAERAREVLSDLKENAEVSDLVLSEIYNLPEPMKDRSTKLVVELQLPSMRLSPSCFSLAEKYLYNRVMKGTLRDWGLHLATAAVRGFKNIVTADTLIASTLLEGTNSINKREGYSEISATLLEWTEDEETKRWFDELRKIRELSYKATSKRGIKDTLKGIETSALHLMKEKSVSIERIGSIEIF